MHLKITTKTPSFWDKGLTVGARSGMLYASSADSAILKGVTIMSTAKLRESKAPKRLAMLILMAIFAFGLASTAVYANNITVTIDGQQVSFGDQQPVIVDGRTLVPVRGVFELMGFEVDWNDEARQAILESEDYIVIITIGSATFTTNGVSHTFDVPAQTIGGRTMVPIRLVLESVGYYLDWDGGTSTVLISAEPFEVAATAVGGISPHGRQVVEEFLMQFPTIFADTFSPGDWVVGEGHGVSQGQVIYTMPVTYVNAPEFWREWGYIMPVDGQFRIGREVMGVDEWGHAITEPIFTREVPEIYFRQDWESWENAGFFNRDGSRITDAPWILGSLYATDFSLWDFDGNGIPVIKVYYWGNYEGSGDGGAPASLFRFVNGEYRRVSYFRDQFWLWGDHAEATYWWSVWQGYYFNSAGNLIGYFYGIVEPMPLYVHINFDNNLANINPIARAQLDWENLDWTNPDSIRFYWTNYQTGETNFVAPAHVPWEADSNVRRIIPGTNDVLTPIHPLVALQEEIAASVAARLGQGR